MREYSRFRTSDDDEDEDSTAADVAPLLGASAGPSSSLAAHGASLRTAWSSLFKVGTDGHRKGTNSSIHFLDHLIIHR